MSVLLDIAVGLIVVFVLFSIVVSGVAEWSAQLFARRGNFLRLGMRRLINDEAVYRRVLHHPLIGSLYRDRAAQGKPPSYIDAGNFALALSQVLIARANVNDAGGHTARPLSVTALREALRAPSLAGSPVSMALSPIFDQAGDDLDAALKGIEAWFGSAMNRVGGWYKARTQKIVFAIGLVLAAVCNVDSIEIYSALNRSSETRAELVGMAQSMTASGRVGAIDLTQSSARAPTPAELASLRPMMSAGLTLPVGYACLGVAMNPDAAVAKVDAAVTNAGAAVANIAATVSNANAATVVIDASDPWRACKTELTKSSFGRSPAAWLLKLIGWALTAFAGTLGAAYWFQLLTKAIDIRGSGSKPPSAPAVLDNDIAGSSGRQSPSSPSA
ncbi:MAG: hypothetical protein ABI612_07215 [Betaproteobacteria bacterium]